MKIYVVLGAIIAALAVWAFSLKADLAKVSEQNAFIWAVNQKMSADLKALKERSELEKKLIVERFEEALKVEQKKQKALDYVKNSNERNVSKLFNDTLLLLQ